MMRIPVDHLVYATSDLHRGMREIEVLTGIAPVLGGRHAGRGTRNGLTALGHGAYLEIIAPDPDQSAPARGRWLGVDSVTSSRLTAWSVKGLHLKDLRSRAIENGVPVGEVHSAARLRPAGVKLSWSVTEPEPLVADGVIPFFIDWGDSPHPSASVPRGAMLLDLSIEHPDAEKVRSMLRALDLDVSVTAAEKPGIVAVIDCPLGRVELR